MKLETIICELNPIHLGHQAVINRAKSTSDAVAAVMSGNFTQRAEPALFDKYTRAQAAILAGCDIVFELPYPWCSAGIEGFACGGVAVAAGILTDGLTCGSESGSLTYVSQLADIKASDAFKSAITKTESAFRDAGAAAVFEKALAGFGVTDMPGANDKLAAEYIRFSRETGIRNVNLVKRLSDVKSASELRLMDFHSCRPYIPTEAYEFLTDAHSSDIHQYDTILYHHARLYLTDTTNPLLQIAAKKARAAVKAEAFLQTIATKKYTAARMRRELLYSITNVRAEWLKTPPRYTILLAANERGRAYLAENRKKFTFPVITKPADYAVSDMESAELRQCHALADELYCLLSGLSADSFMKRHPVML